MSKLDAQRAMREAKYARNQAAAQSRGSRSPAPARERPPVAPPVEGSAAPAGTAEDGPDAVGTPTSTCGHKSMNGRACTREAGHSEKSHRYS